MINQVALDFLTSSLGYSVIGFIVGFILGQITAKFDILVVNWFHNFKENQ